MISTILPAIAFIVMAFFMYKRQKDITQISVVGSIVLIFCLLISYLVLCLSIRNQVTDTETWGGWVIQGRYYEAWNEYIHRTCTRTVTVGKMTRTEIYDCSYIEYHPEEYIVDDSNGNEVYVSESEFNSLCNKLGNRTFRELNRRSHTIDGDMYYTKWTGTEQTFTKFFTQHRYANKGKYLIHGTVENLSGLHEYPKFDRWNDGAVLGHYGNSDQADEILQTFNSKHGADKQIKLYILLFSGEIEAAKRQKILWQNGNKNEFVLCVGLKDGKINWVDHFCWSPDGHTGNDMMGLEMRSFIGKDADIVSLANGLVSETKSWKRKEFDELEYIVVDASQTSKWIVFGINLIGCVAIFLTPIMEQRL